jgi:hypothetical protein
MPSIARLSGATLEEVAAVWPAVSEKFSKVKAGYQNRRLEEERGKLKRRTKSGKKAAQSRWEGGCDSDAIDDANSMRIGCESHTSRVANANANANGTATAHATADAFALFWAAVPNKVGKRGAEKAYKAAIGVLTVRSVIDPHGFLLERMKLFAASPIGRGEPQFIPHPATWLNNGRYEDDPATWQRRPNDPRGTLSAAQEYLAHGK